MGYRMSYILDNKNAEYIFPVLNAPGPGYILEDTSGDGILQWVLISSGSGNPSFNFKRIIDSGVNYLLGTTDYAVEIVSDTYTAVTLPSAADIGGRVFFISRGSNVNIILTAQSGETIDGLHTYTYYRKYTHLTVMSNNVNVWYIV